MNSINFYYNKRVRNFAPMFKLYTFVVATLLLFGCKSSNNAVVLDANAFHTSVSASNVQLVDVRTPEEFEKGHIANAINIDIKSADFEKRISGLYKDVPVYVYCRKGSRSADAASRLKSDGFAQVFELKGGLNDWTAAGLPVSVSQPEFKKPDFQTAIAGDKLVLVDFNATWCGPCKMMQPFVDRIDRERTADVIVYSIDTDEQPALAQAYQITQLPTFMLFKKGKVLEKSIGYMEEEKLNALVNKHL